MKWKIKPTEVDAIQWNGQNLDDVKEFVGDALHIEDDRVYEIIILRIKAISGEEKVKFGDFIVKNKQGLYSCPLAVFLSTHEQI